jgi:Flp pilus assembly pilin Flp
MKNLMNRINYVMNSEDGASNVEIVVWISVVLIIATVLYLFKDAIIGFLQRAINRVNNLGVGNAAAGDHTYDN